MQINGERVCLIVVVCLVAAFLLCGCTGFFSGTGLELKGSRDAIEVLCVFAAVAVLSWIWFRGRYMVNRKNNLEQAKAYGDADEAVRIAQELYLFKKQRGLYLGSYLILCMILLMMLLIIFSVVNADYGYDSVQRYNDAMEYYAVGEHEKALPIFNELIERRSDEALFYGLRAQSHGALGEESDYFADWRKAMELYDPEKDKGNWEFFQYGKAWNAYIRGQHEEALEKINKLINVETNDPMAYALRAELLVCLDQLSNSLPDWEQALSLYEEEGPQRVQWLYCNLEKARTHYFMDDWTNAQLYLNLAIDNKYEIRDALDLRCAVYYNMGQYEEALDDVNRLVTLTRSNDAMVVGMRAETLEKMGRYEEALVDFRTMVAMGESVDIGEKAIDRITEKMGTATSERESK